MSEVIFRTPMLTCATEVARAPTGRAMRNPSTALVRAELKAEAVRAGMIDLDGLKLVDPADVRVNEAGEIEGAAMLMQKLRRAKPWLFGERIPRLLAWPPGAAAPGAACD